MKVKFLFPLLSLSVLLIACQPKAVTAPHSEKTNFDWLVNPERSSSFVEVSDDGKELTIGNAMVSRTFRLDPDLSTISLLNRMSDEEMIRAASPEGILSIDGKDYAVGGLAGQKERGYLKSEWLDEMQACENAFHLEGYAEGSIEEPIHWARSRWALNKERPTGRTVTFTLRGEAPLDSVIVRVIVAAYDHIPVISKQIEVSNNGSRAICMDAFRLEHLSFSEPDSPVSCRGTFMTPNIHVESDYNIGGAFTHQETDATTNWVVDPAYTSQRNYSLKTPCILDVNPPIGPSQMVEPQGTFRTFTVYEMPFDSYDRERQGLFQRRFYRTVVPWTTENPIFLHLTSNDPDKIRAAVDQAAETG